MPLLELLSLQDTLPDRLNGAAPSKALHRDCEDLDKEIFDELAENANSKERIVLNNVIIAAILKALETESTGFLQWKHLREDHIASPQAAIGR